MSFKSLEIQNTYDSSEDNLVEDFYIPVLSEAVKYDRIAGFFNSTSLAIAARGILGLIRNQGRIRILASPLLSNEDISAIEKASENPELILSNTLISGISNIDEEFLRNHVSALGWLIANNQLEIRIVLVKDKNGKILDSQSILQSGLFHQKVGILTDLEGNNISFSGSINETAKGWLDNIEEFKVFRHWEAGQYKYCESDIEKFDGLWNGNKERTEVFSLPEAVKNHLIVQSKNNIEDLLAYKHYRSRYQKKEIDLSLFDYQKKAVYAWENNKKNIILEMATGTGKTRTAIACIAKTLKQVKPIVVIVACPQNTLLLQWKNEIEKLQMPFDHNVIADGSNPHWRQQVTGKLLDVTLGTISNLIIYTTHSTFSSPDFIDIILKNKGDTKFLLIGDEMHGLGAAKTKRGLLEIYDYRIGLSATPRRWYDETGTELIYKFFGNTVYEFSIKHALLSTNPKTHKSYLVHYYYYPIFVSLTDSELEKYMQLSKKITKLMQYSNSSDEYSEILENLLFQRANIHKSAENKIPALDNLLSKIAPLEDLLVFVSPEHLSKVCLLMGNKGFRVHQFTEKEGTVPEKRYGGRTERQYLIDQFKEKKLQALIAIKCLDEGIDIPSARSAILLASSTNPREYIQRLGRVLRQNLNKPFAFVYDVIVVPDFDRLDGLVKEFEAKIFAKEKNRIVEIASNSINNVQVCNLIYSKI